MAHDFWLTLANFANFSHLSRTPQRDLWPLALKFDLGSSVESSAVVPLY
jgi:hypothetical protein